MHVLYTLDIAMGGAEQLPVKEESSMKSSDRPTNGSTCAGSVLTRLLS